MKNSEKWLIELGEALRCSSAGCRCEGTKAFADRPEERYCSDCYEAIRSVRLLRTVPR